MIQAPWMTFAWADLAVVEHPGPDDNPRIVDYFGRVGHAQVQHDETPWCAAFVGACLERAGLRSSRSLRARSYLEWGVGDQPPALGAVVVLSRGTDATLGHVGFLVGLTDDRVVLLGGNQSDAVTVAAFDRSRVLDWRWPAPADGPATSAPADDTHRFEAALAMVLAFEGGWTDDPFDPGGPTNKGITLATYADHLGMTMTTAADRGGLVADLKSIPDTVVADIYRERYWQPAHCPDLPPALALFHFDVAVNMGIGTAVRLMQQALDVPVDGVFGPITRAAAILTPTATTLEIYADLRRRRYRSLSTFWRFGRGWLRRCDAALAQAHARDSDTTQPRSEATSNDPSPSPTHQKGPQSMPETPTFPAQIFDKTKALDDGQTKWWGGSLTIWGALLTGLTTVAPVLFAAFGIDLSADMVQRLGSDLLTVAQAVGGLVGTIMTITGRLRATSRIERRPVTLRL